MAINVNLLASRIMIAAKAVGTGAPMWLRSHPSAELQLKTIAGVTADIEARLRSGEIGVKRARHLYQVHETAVRAVLLMDGAEVVFADKLLAAAARAIDGPMARVVAGGMTAAFKAGKDL